MIPSEKTSNQLCFGWCSLVLGGRWLVVGVVGVGGSDTSIHNVYVHDERSCIATKGTSPASKSLPEAAIQGRQDQKCLAVDRPVHVHTFPIQHAEAGNDEHRCRKASNGGSPAKKPKDTPRNRQERQISMPGPTGTADTGIGRPARLPNDTAFSNTSLSPAHCSYKMRSSRNETPTDP